MVARMNPGLKTPATIAWVMGSYVSRCSTYGRHIIRPRIVFVRACARVGTIHWGNRSCMGRSGIWRFRHFVTDRRINNERWLPLQPHVFFSLVRAIFRRTMKCALPRNGFFMDSSATRANPRFLQIHRIVWDPLFAKRKLSVVFINRVSLHGVLRSSHHRTCVWRASLY